jgi:hypothetical protein
MGDLRAISFLNSSYSIIIEYPIFSLEHSDFIIVCKGQALIVEAKGVEK